MPGDPKPVTDNLPIVDLAPLGEGEAGLDKVAAAIGAACRDVGFFYVVNRGVKRDLMDEAFAEARRFFALPLADKEAIAMRIVGGNRGYSALLREALDPTRPGARARMGGWLSRAKIGIFLRVKSGGGPSRPVGATIRGVELLDAKIPSVRAGQGRPGGPRRSRFSP